MNLILGKSDTHNLIMGWTASPHRDNDFVILGGAAVVGRIYLDTIYGGIKKAQDKAARIVVKPPAAKGSRPPREAMLNELGKMELIPQDDFAAYDADTDEIMGYAMRGEGGEISL